jgi:hypothetical protein
MAAAALIRRRALRGRTSGILPERLGSPEVLCGPRPGAFLSEGTFHGGCFPTGLTVLDAHKGGSSSEGTSRVGPSQTYTAGERPPAGGLLRSRSLRRGRMAVEYSQANECARHETLPRVRPATPNRPVCRAAGWVTSVCSWCSPRRANRRGSRLYVISRTSPMSRGHRLSRPKRQDLQGPIEQHNIGTRSSRSVWTCGVRLMPTFYRRTPTSWMMTSR